MVAEKLFIASRKIELRLRWRCWTLRSVRGHQLLSVPRHTPNPSPLRNYCVELFWKITLTLLKHPSNFPKTSENTTLVSIENTPRLWFRRSRPLGRWARSETPKRSKNGNTGQKCEAEAICGLSYSSVCKIFWIKRAFFLFRVFLLSFPARKQSFANSIFTCGSSYFTRFW